MSHHRQQNIAANYLTANEIELGPEAVSYIQSVIDAAGGAGGDLMAAGGGLKGNCFTVPHSVLFSYNQGKYVMDDPSFTFDVVNKTLIVPKAQVSYINNRPITEFGDAYACGGGTPGKIFTARSIIFAQGNNKNLQDDPAFSYDPFTQTMTVNNVNVTKINGLAPTFGDISSAGGGARGKPFSQFSVPFSDSPNGKYLRDDPDFLYNPYTQTLSVKNVNVVNVNGAPLGAGSGDLLVAGGGVKGAVLSANCVLFAEGNNKYARDDSAFSYNPFTKTLNVTNISAASVNGIVPGNGDVSAAGSGIKGNAFSPGTILFSHGSGKFIMDDTSFAYNTLTKTLSVSNILVNNINGLPPGGGSGGDLFAAGNGIKGLAFTAKSVLFANGNDKYVRDDADFNYDPVTKTLSVNTLVVSDVKATSVVGAGDVYAAGNGTTGQDFTANGVVFSAGAGKLLRDDPSFTYNTLSKCLTVTNVSATTVNGLVIGSGVTGDLIAANGNSFAENTVLFSNGKGKTVRDDTDFTYDPDTKTLSVVNLAVNHITGDGQNSGILQLQSGSPNIVLTPSVIGPGQTGSVGLNLNLTGLQSVITGSLTCAGNTLPLTSGNPGQALVTSGGGTTFWHDVGNVYAFGVDESLTPTKDHSFGDGCILFSYGNSTNVQDFPLLKYDTSSFTLKTFGIAGISSGLSVSSDGSVFDTENNGVTVSCLDCTNKAYFSSVIACNTCTINTTTSTTNHNFSLIGSSQNCTVTGDLLSVISCVSCLVTNDHARSGSTNATVIASSNCTVQSVSGNLALIGCTGIKLMNIWDTATLNQCVFIASGSYDTSLLTSGQPGTGPSQHCLVAGSVNSGIASTTSDQKSNILVLGSKGVLGKNNYSVCGGYGLGLPSTANRTWEFDSVNGNLYLAGSVISGVSLPDTADWFGNGTGKEIPVGSIVRLVKGRKVVPAKISDPSNLVIGVVASTPAYTAGSAWSHWKGKYETDEWGRPVKIKQYDAMWTPGPNQTEADRPYTMVKKLSQAYDPKKPYVPQSERPNDYTCVALVGQPRVRVDGTVREFDFVCPSETTPGLGTRCMNVTRFLCMEILKPYGRREDGGYYGIAVCLLR